MSNIIKVPHTVTFLAEINIDKLPANLLPALIALTEEQLTAMVQETTVHALKTLDFVKQANDGGGWAFVSLAE
jgi:hypothetical protein